MPNIEGRNLTSAFDIPYSMFDIFLFNKYPTLKHPNTEYRGRNLTSAFDIPYSMFDISLFNKYPTLKHPNTEYRRSKPYFGIRHSLFDVRYYSSAS